MFLFVLPLFAQWEPDQRLTWDGSYSYTSYNNARCIGAGPGGLLHVVWYDGRNGGTCEIYYKRSTDGGTTWSGDTRLTNDPAQSDYPALAVQDSNLYVTWFDGRNGGWSVYTKRSTDYGATWGPDVLQSHNGGANSMWPSVCASGPNIVVVWADNRNGGNSQLYYVHSTDYGATWAPEVHLTFTPSFFPSLSASGSYVHLVWKDTRIWHDLWYKRSTDGGATWGPDTCLSDPPNYSQYASVSASGPNVHIAFYDSRTGNTEIFYQRSTDYGFSWERDIQLTSDGGASRSPSIADSGANVSIAWEETRDGNREVYYKSSLDMGSTWGPDVRLTEDPAVSMLPSIALADTMVHVVWTDQRDGNLEIYYKRDPTGNIGVEETDDRYQITDQVFPNPFVSYTRILGYEQESFTLYDISGRVVGVYKGDRIGVDLSPGVYFLMSENNNTKPIRIVKVR
jgi:hypothetical protein